MSAVGAGEAERKLTNVPGVFANLMGAGFGPRLITVVGVMYGAVTCWILGVAAFPGVLLLLLGAWLLVAGWVHLNRGDEAIAVCGALVEAAVIPATALLGGLPADLALAFSTGLVAAAFAQGGIRVGLCALLIAGLSVVAGLALQPAGAAPPGLASALVGLILLFAWGATMGLLGFHQRRELRMLSERERVRVERMERVAEAYGRYLSPQVRSALFDKEMPLPLPRRRRWVTVMFADMAGFTRMTEVQEAEQLALFVNDYLEAMAGVAVQYGGTIDKFIGDAVMVFFGDPDSAGRREDAVACVRMALAMRERLRRLVDDWRLQGTPLPLRARIGIASGYCTVGSFGAAERMDYTLLGSAVNMASRLQGQAQEDQVLIAPSTWALVQGAVPCASAGICQLRGFSKATELFEVLGERTPSLHVALPGLELRLDPQLADVDRVRAELEAAAASLEDRLPVKTEGSVAASGPLAPRYSL